MRWEKGFHSQNVESDVEYKKGKMRVRERMREHPQSQSGSRGAKPT